MEYRINGQEIEITSEYHNATILIVDNDIPPEQQAEDYISFHKKTSEEIIEMRNDQAKQYLSDTDWYITRQAETGQDIPEEVKQLRAEARAKIK